MTDPKSSAQWPEDFCGCVKLFPLPNLVLFPHVIQPLHIFEPRYCEMLADSLASDRLIAMALLEKGWEYKFQTLPPIDQRVCVGKVISHTPTEDGRHNILLVGMKRGRITRELTQERSYRSAEVEILEDYYPEETASDRPRKIKELQDVFLKFVPEGLAAQESFQQLLGQTPPLGVLTDVIAYAMNLPLSIKQQLLTETNVDMRGRILIRCLEQRIAERDDSPTARNDIFPPPFSDN